MLSSRPVKSMLVQGRNLTARKQRKKNGLLPTVGITQIESGRN